MSEGISLKLEGHEGHPQASSLEAQVVVFEHAIKLMAVKSTGYGEAWREQGWMGNVARIMSKTTRIKNLVWRDDVVEMHGDETPQDTLLDLVNLAAFALRNMAYKNRWGNGRG